ncbi:NUDIX hydrolase [Candidatus Gottesmanbacteria bacterium]|nr:NUDIX hydrolase [Candidatus Gottesmanbacteria bacterium]MBI5465646.1 NUDIX hydrolase [Candidatus Gottesmanbacteria bacterium]
MITCSFEDGDKASLRHLVVHAILEKDGKILLGKRSSRLSGAGKWCMPGGFLDRDETAEEAVLRELLEETGWQGEIDSLFRINSNPERGEEDKRQNVALEFIINPIKQIKKPDKELKKVEWIPIKELDSLDFAFDHGETVKLYLEYRQKPFALPILV